MKKRDGEAACRHSLGQEGRELVLTLECKECGGRGPFSDPGCLGGALEVLSAESGVDSLIVSGHLECQLRPEGMAVLDRLVLLAGDLQQLSLRDPPRGYRDCGRCALRPAELFPSLRTVLLADAAGFPSALRDRIARLLATGRPAGEVCRQCLTATAEDLDLLSRSFEELARFIIKQGFQIVV
ncbi:MAG: hypothetical protein FJ149_11780 [Euryarchaeota archaeon]|nr:hypothetical protein [Euryarchaeota archaeon]